MSFDRKQCVSYLISPQRPATSLRLALLVAGIAILGLFLSQPCLAQLRGSPEAQDLIDEQRGRLAAQKAKYEKDLETGKRMFGVSEKWDASANGTLHGKLPIDFAIGDWGRFERSLKVLNKIGENEVLVVPDWRNTEPMLIRGIDNSKVTSGATFIFCHPVVVTGTYDYPTVGGSVKSVLVLNCDPKIFDERLTVALAEQAAEEEQAWQQRWTAEKRTWTDKTGKFKVDAVFDVDVGGGKIRLLKEDKSELIVELSKLSESDRRKAIELRKQAEAKSQQPAR